MNSYEFDKLQLTVFRYFEKYQIVILKNSTTQITLILKFFSRFLWNLETQLPLLFMGRYIAIQTYVAS